MSEAMMVDTCVIGAGVVGLAVARACALMGQEVVVLEREPRFGEGTSSRNSEVIHAGIYYPADSLKASLCVRGKHLLYEYCLEHNVAHRRLGKLIVATTETEAEQLTTIQGRAAVNGVDDLRVVEADQLSRLEPNVAGYAALLSPSTGIVSAAELMTSYLGDLESAGGVLACRANVVVIHQDASGFTISSEVEGEAYEFQCRRLVNSAGLAAQKIANSIEGLSAEFVPELHLCRGSYFLLQGKNPFQHLIYPVPPVSGAGLGVHATIDLGDQVKFGPDIEYISEENYEVSEQSLIASYADIRRYYPGLRDDALVPGYAGIRPKLQGPDDPVADFVIQGEDAHAIAGLVNLFGIESPGLTSSLAIAETVADLLA